MHRKSLKTILSSQWNYSVKGLEYKVTFHPVDTTETNVIYEDKSLTVETIPLEHRVPCCGFCFAKKPTAPHIRRDMIDYYNIPISQINNVKGRSRLDYY